MEKYASLLHIFTSIVILVGLILVYLRIKYLITDKRSKRGINILVLGEIWLPIPIDKEDGIKVKRQKNSLNFGLKLFYVLFLMLFLLMLVYGIMLENV